MVFEKVLGSIPIKTHPKKFLSFCWSRSISTVWKGWRKAQVRRCSFLQAVGATAPPTPPMISATASCRPQRENRPTCPKKKIRTE